MNAAAWSGPSQGCFIPYSVNVDVTLVWIQVTTLIESWFQPTEPQYTMRNGGFWSALPGQAGRFSALEDSANRKTSPCLGSHFVKTNRSPIRVGQLTRPKARCRSYKWFVNNILWIIYLQQPEHPLTLDGHDEDMPGGPDPAAGQCDPKLTRQAETNLGRHVERMESSSVGLQMAIWAPDNPRPTARLGWYPDRTKKKHKTFWHSFRNHLASAWQLLAKIGCAISSWGLPERRS